LKFLPTLLKKKKGFPFEIALLGVEKCDDKGKFLRECLSERVYNTNIPMFVAMDT